MPKRTDLRSILIIGSGPIVIGQGAEFDYSGVQACRALKEEGYRVVLINSNPATIMTDPQFADATYVEPITPETVEKILKREQAQGTPVDAVLPTLGGQTGLNTAMACFDGGVFERYGVEMIGANREAIWRGEDRQAFKDLMISIGLKVPASRVVHTMAEARETLEALGLPLIIRPAFTLGGTGGGIAYNREEFEDIVERGLEASPYTEVLIEQSVIGWKEFELEVIRDKADNAIVVCSIENIDPMGVHTGDSITVAPIQTLTDKEYQRMRNAALAVIRAVGVETGGSNIQFAVNPADGEMVVVEMNPRVSRSSALASKATGYPIAKIAAKLAVGYTLDELPNDITGKTVAAFEPTIDYVVVKMPRWTFEKFPEADETLTTQMKSVGEAMAIGRTFKEALQKAIRSMEVGRFGLGLDKNDKWLAAQDGASPGGAGFQPASGESRSGQDARTTSTWPIPEETLRRKLAVPSQGRLYYIRYALKMGWSVEQVGELTKIDPWFLHQIRELVEFEDELDTEVQLLKEQREFGLRLTNERAVLMDAKRLGYSDVQLASAYGRPPGGIRARREALGIRPVYKLVDTCAAEFEAATPYYYSTYETPFELIGGAGAAYRSRARTPQAQSVASGNSPHASGTLPLASGTLPLASGTPPHASGTVPHVSGTIPHASGILPIASGTVPLAMDTSAHAMGRAIIASAEPHDARRSATQVMADDEIRISDRPKVIIIGGGPNRIGQGIEFDYCCVHAAYAMRELGYESVMINSNPETVSTDYDTSDLLFFEPLTHEDVLNVCERLNGGAFRSETSRDREGAVRPERPESLADARGSSPIASGAETSRDRKGAVRAGPRVALGGLEDRTDYLITFTTYGTWLHGDERGSVDRNHNHPDEPHLDGDPAREREEFESLKHTPFVLDEQRRAVAQEAIIEVCRHRGWRVSALHVRTNHLHAVVTADVPPERVMIDFKSYSTRALRKHGLLGSDAKAWTRHGSTRYLNNEEGYLAARSYVLHEQGSAIMPLPHDGEAETGPLPYGRGSLVDAEAGPLPYGRGSSGATSGTGLVKGVIVQFGGQTPLNLAKGLEEAGVPILGTSVYAIHRAGSREQFRELIQKLGLRQPPNGIARNLDDARRIAAEVGYPVLVRPSFVLGGRAMEIVYDEPALNRYMTVALAAAGLTGIADSPILVDKFLDNATEVDVDCVADFAQSPDREGGVSGSDPSRAPRPEPVPEPLPHGRGSERSVICGVMEHIEEAGIHSGDSACVLPPYSLSAEIVAELKRQTHALAAALQVRGLMNVQFAVKDGEVYIIEVNPRASRTIPFVGKATGVPWASIAAKVMAGQSLDELGVVEPLPMNHVAVKEAVFPFAKFPGVDIILGPEMRSTGEVMGIDATFPVAYAKALLAEGTVIPLEGTLFVSVRDADKALVIPIARKFAELGFALISTSGTHAALTAAGIAAMRIPKIAEQSRPNLGDYIKNRTVHLILNTPTKKGAGTDEAKIRALAFRNRVPIVTTLTGGMAFARAIEALRAGDWDVRPLQDYHAAAARS